MHHARAHTYARIDFGEAYYITVFIYAIKEYNKRSISYDLSSVCLLLEADRLLVFISNLRRQQISEVVFGSLWLYVAWLVMLLLVIGAI